MCGIDDRSECWVRIGGLKVGLAKHFLEECIILIVRRGRFTSSGELLPVESHFRWIAISGSDPVNSLRVLYYGYALCFVIVVVVK